MNKLFLLFLFIALTYSFKVYKDKTKCYVEAYKDSEQGQKIYLDMSEYLYKKKYLISFVHECDGYTNITNLDLPNTCINRMGYGGVGEGTVPAFYLNGHSMLFYFNPCTDVDAICYDVANDDVPVKGNGCIGIVGNLVKAVGNKISTFPNTKPFIIPLNGVLRTIKKEVIENAIWIYSEQTLPYDLSGNYGNSRFMLTLKASTKIKDMVPARLDGIPFDDQDLVLLHNLMNYNLDVHFDGYQTFSMGDQNCDLTVTKAGDASAQASGGGIDVHYQLSNSPDTFSYITKEPDISASYRCTIVAGLFLILVFIGLLF